METKKAVSARGKDLPFTIPSLLCQRCGGEWVPRTPRVPLKCPRCNSPYWTTPRTNNRGKPVAKGGGGGVGVGGPAT